jgi:hypothetical protein
MIQICTCYRLLNKTTMLKTLCFAVLAIVAKPAPTFTQLRSVAKPANGCKYVKPALIGTKIYL